MIIYQISILELSNNLEVFVGILRKECYNFVINGAAGVGKDTFIELIKKNLKSRNGFININNISTVDHIKDIAKNSFGWNGIKDEKGRRLLADLKDANIRYNDGPLKKIISNINEFSQKNPVGDIINFIHTREPDEIDKFKKLLENCYTILIRRNETNIYKNHADRNVEHYIYDFIINNHGSLDTFDDNINIFIEMVLLK
jgi:predicted AAA+ superfamily ATPase